MAQFRGFVERPVPRAGALLAAGLGTGVASGHGSLALMPCCFLFIALFRYAPTRLQRWALAIGYYGGFTITMFPGAAIFFGHEFNPFGITVLWLAISTTLAAPWALLCRPDPARLAWAVPFAIGLETLPPLGLIAVGNPLNSAGVLFPHAGWFGLAVVFLFSSLPAIFPRYALSTIVLIVGITSLLAHPPKAPEDWQGVNTTLGGQGLDAADAMRNYQTALYIQKTALKSPASVVIFPESLLRWNSATEAFWRPSLQKLHDANRTMVLGATIVQPGASGDYRNVAVLRGADNQVIDQRIPIPFTMWNPLASPTVPLNLYGSAMLHTHHQNAALLICYEQLLTLPLAQSMMEKPSLLVGIANDYWAKGTYFPAIQLQNLRAWGQLFNIPVVTAVNE